MGKYLFFVIFQDCFLFYSCTNSLFTGAQDQGRTYEVLKRNMGGEGDLEPLSRQISNTTAATATTGGFEESMFDPESA